ncbi:hypothetical protein [Polaromonas sp. CG9_12]|uniref:hypothetical protein n=1 Tax=Polaromonas sp. CG_9.11 TaxID=2787730 RepID=UPI0004DDDAE3|nr:hypothetical protein [Polaromonas sp. CG_9.11]MBG6075393.1 hypothetical protein [Polaromonas sp. CG_9.11]CDS54325.1 hypothetical protein [Polaromonas sp. CG9_12]
MNHHRFSLTLPLALRALALLALIIVAEVVNGTVRTLVIAPLVGDFTARQIGTVTGCILIGLIAWFGSPWLKAASPRAQWAVGVLWLMLMMGFEVAFGRLLAGASWEQLAADYNLAQGGLLGLGMLWLLCAPRLAAVVRQWQASPGAVKNHNQRRQR